MKHIVMFSGGKDSTAMLLMMIEKGMQIDDIVFADTTVDFPEMHEHIERVENYINRKITRLKIDFRDRFHHVKRNGKHGFGWPDSMNRWCTAEKKQIIERHLRGKNYTEYHGIAIDERERENRNTGRNIKYPLIEWGMTEREALEYCYDKGFNWGGLYENLTRVSCYLCPLSRLNELEYVYNNYPELWENMKTLDNLSERQFRSDYSLSELDRRFKDKSMQGLLFGEHRTCEPTEKVGNFT